MYKRAPWSISCSSLYTVFRIESKLRKSTGILPTSNVIRHRKVFEDSCRSAYKLSETIYELSISHETVLCLDSLLRCFLSLFLSSHDFIVFVVLVNKLIKLTFINTEWESHTHTHIHTDRFFATPKPKPIISVRSLQRNTICHWDINFVYWANHEWSKRKLSFYHCLAEYWVHASLLFLRKFVVIY